MKILIVDDIELNREILEDMLYEEGYETITACDGEEALEILRLQHAEIHAILMDLVMPRMDGFSLMHELNQQSWFPDIPVIVISGENEQQTEVRCLDLGATDFIHKPFIRSVVLRRIKNSIQLYLHKKMLEQLVAQQTQELREKAEQIRHNNETIIDILGTVVEYRNLESGEHIARVKGFVSLLARKMIELYPESGLTQEEAKVIVAASPLHDIGKITIPDHIMLKPGRLTAEEFEQMKAHTTNGAEMLRRIKGAWDEEYALTCYDICLYHHERFDGKGYPQGLVGDEIPLSAQLVSIADVYDALINKRVYKDAYTLDRSYHMIMDGECGTFSPEILECFRQVRGDFEALARADVETDSGNTILQGTIFRSSVLLE